MNEPVTLAIHKFLSHYAQPDLAKLYTPGAEVQVMVKPESGTPVLDAKGVYTKDNLYQFYNFRIPKNARTQPEFTDFTLRWPLEVHAHSIGMTGWNFAPEPRSMFLAYDFDALTDTTHKSSGISQEELDRVREAACQIPWVTVRRSTSGSGLHLYVHLGDGVPTENHTEHAALGKAVLGIMSRSVGHNFNVSIDAIAGNTWIWSRRATPENRGLTCIKKATEVLTDVPDNWRDHVDVVSRRRSKVVVPGIPDNKQGEFAAEADRNKTTDLDQDHVALMDWLAEHGYTVVYEPDHGLMRTHTAALADAHESLGLKGVYKTLSTGREKGDANSFCFPRPQGAWKVVRYGSGTAEAETWNRDGEYTFCYFNQKPTLSTVAKLFGAIEDKAGGYWFESLAEAAKAAASLGSILDVPTELESRKTKLKEHKDGKLLVTVEKTKDDEDSKGFRQEKTGHVRVVDADMGENENPADDHSSSIRHVLDLKGDAKGWLVNIAGQWSGQNVGHVDRVLMSKGMDGSTAKAVTGTFIDNAWQLVNIPFGPEYPGGRRWNRDAVQFRFTPSDEEGPHPHWDLVLDHCGENLTQAVLAHAWCQENGLFTGGDYLRHWIAAMFQYPFQRLPYLFFYSEEQNTGKSTFHQALKLLMTRGGVERADAALTNDRGFNGELMSCILAVIEELDMSKAGQKVYDRLKDWVVSPDISIHVKGLTPYVQPNTTHFCQVSNYQRAVPVFEGDTRITMARVNVLQKEVVQAEMLTKLEEEAPNFLRTLLNMNLPPPPGRLRVPCLETEEKSRAMELTRDELQVFLSERCFYVPGAKMSFSDFFDGFHESLGVAERARWTKNKVSGAMPAQYPRGVGAGNKTYIGNIAFEPPAEDYVGIELVRSGNKLVVKE